LEHRESKEEAWDGSELESLLEARMPFGKYQGLRLLDLPEAYLVWFQRQGFPGGKLGRQLQSALEIKANGLLGVLDPLRKPRR
jgi:uncharacterized protein (DUF3820 family)